MTHFNDVMEVSTLVSLADQMGPAGLFVCIAMLVCLVGWFFMRFFIRRGRRLLRFLFSLLYAIGGAIASHEDVRRWTSSHPRTMAFLKKRTSRETFGGLTLTLLTIAFVYALLAFIGVVHDIATVSVFAEADVRVENLLYAYRSVPVTAFFLWITMLGSWQVVASVLVGASIVLYTHKHERFIIPLWVTVFFSEVIGLISKNEFHRPRPEGVAVYVEQSFSFPSAHSIVAVSLYGFLMYIAMRYAKKWRHKIYICFFGVAIIALIGLSRLYVGVHYVSDVWGGYLLGLLWLIIGISLSEWLSHFKYHPPSHSALQSRRLAYVGTGIATLIIGVTYIFMGRSGIDLILSNPPSFEVSNRTTNSALHIFTDGAPRYAETISGNHQEPIAFIITAPSEEAFTKAFERASWRSAEHLSSRSIVRMIRTMITSGSYPTAPMTPSFWNQEVNDFAFQKPTPADSIEERHHARFWRTAYVTEDGKRVYVGTASLDTNIKWFITHAIAPDIDSEREVLLQDLLAGGDVDHVDTVQLVPPVLGKNIFGDLFFTDGKAHVLELK